MTLQEHIDEVMDNFDFEKVKRVMDMLGWRWAECDGVPDIADLRRSVRRKITRTWERATAKRTTCSTDSGGFVVTVEPYRGCMNVRVEFVVADFDSNPDPRGVLTLGDAWKGGEG